jgi:hypothetical protein
MIRVRKAFAKRSTRPFHARSAGAVWLVHRAITRFSKPFLEFSILEFSILEFSILEFSILEFSISLF